MTHTTRRRALSLAIGGLALLGPALASADAAKIDGKVDAAIGVMTSTIAGTQELLDTAKGVLIIPDIVKAGFVVGGAYGEGVLRVGGETVGYYSVAAASFGLQAGVQSYGQAVFFMTDDALAAFRASKGWQAGVDAEVTVLDKGLAAGLDTTSRSAPVIAVVFGQNGLLAGASIEGGKITQIVP